MVGGLMVPDYIVHYSRGEPFRTLTSVPEAQWSQTLPTLNEDNAWGLARFKDLTYLSQRLEVEKQMRANFLLKGGKPILLNPIYCFLGRNAKFEESPKNRGYKISLKDISENAISFTYGDSMLSLHEENRRLSGPRYQHELCGQIFSLEELGLLAADSGLHMEAQLWVMPAAEVVTAI